MQEIWKDINGYEGLYQVSNLGRVKSLDRRARNHKNGSTRFVKGQMITATGNGNGYKIVGLRYQRKRENRYVHRLVAEHFIDNPDDKKYINHIDYDTSNNCVENLEWCTQKENIIHSKDHMCKPRNKFKPSNTGEKYIGKRSKNGKYSCYRVNIPRMKICKQFKTLPEAIEYRDNVLKGGDIKWQTQ